jgi:hypothetical protein
MANLLKNNKDEEKLTNKQIIEEVDAQSDSNIINESDTDYFSDISQEDETEEEYMSDVFSDEELESIQELAKNQTILSGKRKRTLTQFYNSEDYLKGSNNAYTAGRKIDKYDQNYDGGYIPHKKIKSTDNFYSFININNLPNFIKLSLFTSNNK